VIVDAKDAALPEIDWLIVAPEFRGRKLHRGNVAQRLMQTALDEVGPGRPVQLGIIHYNARAIAFASSASRRPPRARTISRYRGC
jgi:hypothetical protein